MNPIHIGIGIGIYQVAIHQVFVWVVPRAPAGELFWERHHSSQFFLGQESFDRVSALNNFFAETVSEVVVI